MARFLIDTNVVSEPTRKQPDEQVLKYLRENRSELAISAITLHELIYGCMRLPESKRRKDIERYIENAVLNSLPILEYDTIAARWHAIERARLTSQGKTPSYADTQIAAVAAANKLTLVTRNISDFQDFEGLELISWHE